MAIDLEKIWASKEAYRQQQAELPFAEKVKILNKMRARQVAIAKVREQLAARLEPSDAAANEAGASELRSPKND